VQQKLLIRLEVFNIHRVIISQAINNPNFLSG